MPSLNPAHIKFTFFLFVFLFAQVQVGHSNIVHHPPPVEKAKPVDKKKSKKIKAKRSRKKQLKRNKKQGPDKTMNREGALVWILISLLLLIIAGAFLFGFGIAILPLWITGISIIGLSSLIGFALRLMLIKRKDGSRILFNDMAITGANIFMTMVISLNLLIGVCFLVWGLAIGLSLAWIVGLAIIGLAGLIWLFSQIAIRQAKK